MTAKKYRKKPVEIEAMQFDGTPESATKVIDWVLENGLIYTLEGMMAAGHGDWVIRGVQGEFYPCKPDIFEQTYELV